MADTHIERLEVHNAVRMQDYAKLSLLLQAGADPNQYENGFTPIHWAISIRATDVAELLIENGIDADLQTPDGETAFDLACSKGATEIARMLFYSGASFTMLSLNALMESLATLDPERLISPRNSPTK